MKVLDYIALAIVIIGAVNWGLIGFFRFDLIRVIFGDMTMISRIIYGLVGLCGGVYAQYQGAADVNAGRGAIVIGLAAVIISEVIFGKLCAGKKIAFAYTLASVFVGAILYYIAYALVMWLGIDSDYMKLFSAVVVTCFLAAPYLKGKYLMRRRMAK